MVDLTATSIPKLIIIIKPDFSVGWRGGSAINSTESGGSLPLVTSVLEGPTLMMNEMLQSNTLTYRLQTFVTGPWTHLLVHKQHFKRKTANRK